MVVIHDALGMTADLRSQADWLASADHDPADVPRWALLAERLTPSAHHEPSARDARERIVAFFDSHLRSNPT